MAAPWRGPENGLALFSPDYRLFPADKTMLAPLRVINILALSCLVACFIAPRARWLMTRAAAPILCCGRHSLAVFGVGVWLSVAATVALRQTEFASATYVLVNGGGLAILVALAATLDSRRAPRPAPLPQRVAPILARRAA
jgi:hypothetical protein